MIDEIFFIVEDSLEGGFEARAVGYSIFTQAESYEEIKTNIKEAVSCHFNIDEMPKIIRVRYVKEEVIVA